MPRFRIPTKAAAKTLTAIALLFSFIAFSCSVNQGIRLSVSGSGSVSLAVTLKPVFKSYLLDLSEAVSESGSAEKTQIFKLDEISKSLSAKPGVKISKLASPKQESLVLDFSFQDIKTLLKSVKQDNAKEILTVKDEGGVKELDFYLDKKNYKKLVEFFPYLKNPVFESLAPQEDENISEAEYYDIITFTMGEGGPEAIKNSTVKVTVTVDGTIVSQTGGKINGNEVVFSIPLINMLILKEPIRFSIRYK